MKDECCVTLPVIVLVVALHELHRERTCPDDRRLGVVRSCAVRDGGQIYCTARVIEFVVAYLRKLAPRPD